MGGGLRRVGELRWRKKKGEKKVVKRVSLLKRLYFENELKKIVTIFC